MAFQASTYADNPPPDKMTQQEDSSIELIGFHHTALVGSDVVLAGTTLAQSKVTKLTLALAPPKGAKINATIPVSSDGKFRYVLTAPTELGTYTVELSTPSGKSKLGESFKLVSPTDFAAAAETSYDRIRGSVERSLQFVRQRATALPPSPPRQELLRRLDAIDTAWQRAQSIRPLVGNLARRVQAASGFRPADVAATLGALADWTETADAQDSTVSQFISAHRDMPSTCDSLDTAQEGLALVSTSINVLAKLPIIIKNVFVDKVVPAGIDRLTFTGPNAEANKLAVTEASKSAIAAIEGVDALLSSFGGVFGDIIQYATKQLFTAYCNVLEGPIKADFVADLKSGGKSWWRTRVVLAGKLRLYYEKNQPVSATGFVVRGRAEGNATKIEFSEDIFRVEPLPKATKIVIRKTKTPTVISKSIADEPLGFGLAAHFAVPGSFAIQYEGRLKNDSLQLKQQAVQYDFSSAFVNQLLLVAAQPGIPLPLVKRFGFPIQKAKFILGRASKDDPILPVTVSGDKTTAHKQLVRDETLGDGSTVHWSVDWAVESKK